MKEHFRAFTKTGRELNSAFQWHDDALFIGFVEKGSADVQLPGEKLSIDEGEGFFVNQGAFFSVTSPDETDGCILHAILFSPEDISAPTEPFYETYLSPLIKNNMQKGTALHLDTPWQKEVLRLTEQVFEKLSEEQKKRKRHSRAGCQHWNPTKRTAAGPPGHTLPGHLPSLFKRSGHPGTGFCQRGARQ